MKNIMNNEESLDGFINFVTIDRDDIINTTFLELKSITQFTITFQVDFIGENALDYGGLRLEWIGLMNRAIKEKYFQDGLKSHYMEDYFYVGVMVGISLVQGGIVPMIFNNEELDQIFNVIEPNQIICEVLRGLDEFNLVAVLRNFPIMRHLFTESNFKLSPNYLIKTLKTEFSPNGSNTKTREKKVYSYFVRYLREVASGRRGIVTLPMVLRFITGCESPPALGFSVEPTIKILESSFTEV